MAEKKKIVWKITACSLEKFVLEENEICILFGNLLDNALEASEKVEKGEKWIKTEIQNPGNMLFINIANSMEKQPVKEGKRWISQKENQKFHGYGLIMKEQSDIWSQRTDSKYRFPFSCPEKYRLWRGYCPLLSVCLFLEKDK